MTRSRDVHYSPVTVVIDSREQHPYAFQGFRADANHQYKPLVIPVVCECLHTGDYSIQGSETLIAIERKSLTDLYGTLSQERGRFERELERLAAMERSAVVVEAGWATILKHPPERSGLNPKTVWRSIIAWQDRYPTVHWNFFDTRHLAEHYVYRRLERFWKERQP